MIICQKCKAENPSDSLFCSRCGTKLETPAPLQFNDNVIAGDVDLSTHTNIINNYNSTAIDQSGTIENWLKRITMFIADGNYKDANEYCEKVLDIDPENVQAYIGKLMADFGIHELEDLKWCAKPSIESNTNYQKALRFGDEAIKSTLTDCLNSAEKTWQYFESTFEYDKYPLNNEYKITKLKDKKAKTVIIPRFVYDIDKEAFKGSFVVEVYNLTYHTISQHYGSAFDWFVGPCVLDIYTTPNQKSKIFTTSDGFEFYVNDNICYLIGCNTHANEIRLPTSFNGQNYSIHTGAFSNATNLTSITIPNSVTSIGSHAFRECTSLTSITIPNSVTSIGFCAFDSCTSLTSITIPDSVTSIGGYAFNGCSSLASITIPNSVTNIDTSSFYACDAIKTATIPISAISYIPHAHLETVIITGGTAIDECAFAACFGLKSVTISNGVTSIGRNAFINCHNLTRITIPNSVTNIGSSAFSGCISLTSITLPNSVTNIGSSAFRCCKSLTSITLPNSVTDIGSSAFASCENLTRITIPNSVTSISDSTFDSCTSLTSVTIPNSVTNIGHSAFRCCKSLTSVTIPNSVESIGRLAFAFCDNLTKLSIPKSVTNISNDVFKDSYKLKQNKGCYVATCVYGSYDCPQVWTLRRFRDDTLGSTWYGRLFIRAYYAISPTLVKWFGKTNWFKKLWRSKLDRMVAKLQSNGVEDTPYEDKNW